MTADTPQVYLDANASEPLRPQARDAMLAACGLPLGNPSSGHRAGRRGRRILADAREAVAALVGAEPKDVVLTSGATEANALAIRGVLAATTRTAAVLTLTRAEHPSVLRLAERLAAEGACVRYGGLGQDSRANPAELAALCGNDTTLALLLAAQSVTGAIQPVRAFAQNLAGASTHIHCDATQAVGRVPLAIRDLGVHTLSLSGHKFGAPPGIGALVFGQTVRAGGARWQAPDGAASQELGRRGGTEAVHLAAGLAAAARAAANDLEARGARDRALRTAMLDRLRSTLGGEVVLLSPAAEGDCLANTLLLAFEGCPGDALLAALDGVGICVSAGTACTSLARTPPEVLLASGRTRELAERAVRISWSWATKDSDVAQLFVALAALLPRVRAAYLDRTPRANGS